MYQHKNDNLSDSTKSLYSTVTYGFKRTKSHKVDEKKNFETENETNKFKKRKTTVESDDTKDDLLETLTCSICHEIMHDCIRWA